MLHHILIRSQPVLHQRTTKTDRDVVSQAAALKPWVHIAPIPLLHPQPILPHQLPTKPLTRSPDFTSKASPSCHGALTF